MIKRPLKYAGIIILFLVSNLILVSSGSGEGVGKLALSSKHIMNFEKLSFQSEEEQTPLWEDEFQKPSGRKSTTKAMFLSLLLPGAGELYANNKIRSRIFLGLEGVIWSSFFGFRTYGSWKKRDYKGFATSHAGIDLEGKSDEFFEDLTYYDNRDEYNQFARLYQGEDAIIYPENDFWNWEWDSQDSRGHYRDLRNKSKAAYRKALYMVGLAALNRIVSVLDAAHSVRKFNRRLGSEFSSINQTGLKFDLNANFFGKNPHFFLSLSKSF